MGRELVPRVPSPKLLPKGDGDVGVPWDAHVRLEAPRARRILSVLLEARGRGSRGGVHVYLHLRAELLQLERVAARDVAVRGPGSRLALSGRLEISSRGGAWERDGDFLALVAELGGVGIAALFRPPPAWLPARCGAGPPCPLHVRDAWPPWLWRLWRAGALSVHRLVLCRGLLGPRLTWSGAFLWQV